MTVHWISVAQASDLNAALQARGADEPLPPCPACGANPTAVQSWCDPVTWPGDRLAFVDCGHVVGVDWRDGLLMVTGRGGDWLGPLDFLTVQAHGFERTYLTRLTDGRVMCCLCFDWCTREQLAETDEPGIVEDVCRRCRALEEQAAEERRVGDA
jgi:hypothetical protein